MSVTALTPERVIEVFRVVNGYSSLVHVVAMNDLEASNEEHRGALEMRERVVETIRALVAEHQEGDAKITLMGKELAKAKEAAEYWERECHAPRDVIDM